ASAQAGQRVQRAAIVLFGSLLFGTLSAGVVTTVFAAGSYWADRDVDLYGFAPPEFLGLSRAIDEYGGPGRTFFFGFILQELGAKNYATQDGGHIAPLAELSGHELYASDFYHSRWSTVDPIPLAYRQRGRAGVEEFLDLINVTSVVTFKREWLEYCQADPRYQEVYRGGRFRLFTRDFPESTYFYEGRGLRRRAKDGFSVVPETPTVVLKYRYHPRLTTNYPDQVELFPVFAFDEETGGGATHRVEFVGIRVPPPFIQEGREIHVGFFADE
ncbi:MAG: hypothetical protein KDD44_06355, partial [Bdellovibrionales bacterium]|nr:hypothetical protein [Bdellovibrionales bacterium]